MAGIYKRGKVWWGRVQVNGHEYRESLKTTSRTSALKRLHDWTERLKGQAWGEKGSYTYDDAMMQFIQHHLPGMRPKAALRYKVSAKALSFFSGTPLIDIRSGKLAEFEEKRRNDGVTQTTIIRDLGCLSSMFTYAMVDLEWVDVNPVIPFLKRQRRRGRLRQAPPRTRYLTHSDEAKLLAACGTPELADAIRFAIDTGLRREEQFGLKWSQIDMEKMEIYIPAAKAKSGRERHVPILPRAAQILAQQDRAFDYVFTVDGERLVSRNKGLRDSAKRAGLAHVQWHDLRRTCGCRLLQDHGMRLEQVRDWLGHESVQMTERAYAFLSRDSLHKARTKTGTD